MFGSILIEPIQLQQHSPEPQVQKISSVGKDGVQTGTVPFQPVAFMLHGKRHIGLASLYIQLLKETGQKGVSDVIEDHETSVEGHGRWFVHIDGIGVPTYIAVSFKNRDVVAVSQLISETETGDATTDNTYRLHERTLEGSGKSRSSRTAAGTGCRSQTSPRAR